jgi:hypothetical protein
MPLILNPLFGHRALVGISPKFCRWVISQTLSANWGAESDYIGLR